MVTATRSALVEKVEREAGRALERGDYRQALTVLMDGYGAAIYRFCRQMVGDDDLAQEVQQTVFVQAYAGLEAFRGDSMLKSWLYGIARHRCLDALKSSRRRDRRFVLTDELPEVPSQLDSAHGVETSQLARALKQCLEKLSPKVRSAVLMRFVEGLSFVEMAPACEAQPAALQARVARAMPPLRRCLQSLGVSR